eukprot:UN22164
MTMSKLYLVPNSEGHAQNNNKFNIVVCFTINKFLILVVVEYQSLFFSM